MECHFGLLFPTVTCGYTSRVPAETSKGRLQDCNKDTETHLRLLKLSPGLREGELIAFRADLFTYNGNITGCPQHRCFLGIFWRRKVGRVFPEHSGKCKADRPLNLKMCRNLSFRNGVTRPVGAGE